MLCFIVCTKTNSIIEFSHLLLQVEHDLSYYVDDENKLNNIVNSLKHEIHFIFSIDYIINDVNEIIEDIKTEGTGAIHYVANLLRLLHMNKKKFFTYCIISCVSFSDDDEDHSQDPYDLRLPLTVTETNDISVQVVREI